MNEMNLYSVEIAEDGEGFALAFCWANPEGYDTLANVYDWADEQPHLRGVIEVANESTAKSMIEHSIEAQDCFEAYTMEMERHRIAIDMKAYKQNIS